MTNEEFQKLVLEQLAHLTKGQNSLHQSLTRMEQDHGNKLSALCDAREVQLDVNDRILDTLNRMEGKLDRLSLKVSSHDAELRRAK